MSEYPREDKRTSSIKRHQSLTNCNEGKYECKCKDCGNTFFSTNRYATQCIACFPYCRCDFTKPCRCGKRESNPEEKLLNGITFLMTPGNYECACCHCGRHFFSYNKRSVTCVKCSLLCVCSTPFCTCGRRENKPDLKAKDSESRKLLNCLKCGQPKSECSCPIGQSEHLISDTDNQDSNKLAKPPLLKAPFLRSIRDWYSSLTKYERANVRENLFLFGVTLSLVLFTFVLFIFHIFKDW